VIIGALLVVGAIFFFAGGSDMFASRGGGSSSGPSVTVNTAPSGANPVTRPITPSAPATTGSGQAR
jgi:hypothetical protein